MAKLGSSCVGQTEHLGWSPSLAGARNIDDFCVAVGDDVVQVSPYACRTESKLFANVRRANRSVAQHVEQNAVPGIVIAHWGGHLFSSFVVCCAGTPNT